MPVADVYSLHCSAEAVIRFLERVDPQHAKAARQRYACFDKCEPQLGRLSGLLAQTPGTRVPDADRTCRIHHQVLACFRYRVLFSAASLSAASSLLSALVFRDIAAQHQPLRDYQVLEKRGDTQSSSH